MSEEIRRSGRANKGHHTKNQDALEESAPPPAPAQKPKAQSKADKKGAKAQPARAPTPEEPEQPAEEEDAIYRCVCGEQREIRGREMICCDSCSAWQHNKCLNLPSGEHWEGKNYYCEQCRPEDHEELLAAMARGEKPWARKKGAKPKPRPSDVKTDAAPEKAKTPQRQSVTPSQAAPPTPTKESSPASAPVPAPAPVAAPAQDEANGHAEAKESQSQPQSPQGEKRRHEPSAEKATANKKRRKSSHHEAKATPKGPPADNIDSLPELQKLLAVSLKDALAPLITVASDNRGYRIPDGQTATSLAARFALQISHAAHAHYGEPTGRESPYSSKVRTIMFNTKKNTLLVDQLLSGSLKAPDLVAMEAEEMASEDKQREYAAMREAAEKQMILTEEAGPRMRKTHKGEELVGDDNLDAQEFKQPNLREREEDEDTAMQSPVASRPPESPADAARGPLGVDTSGSQPEHTRRPSTTFDINSVFDKVKSPQQDQQVFMPRRQSSMAVHDKPPVPVDDADVDRLLKDEDNDVEMTGHSSDPTVCWQGSVSMQNVAPFEAVARFVAGGDFGQVVPWDRLLPNALSVQGRIGTKSGDDYIKGLGKAGIHDVAVLALNAVTSEGSGLMDHFTQYFHSRARWGVVPVESLGNDIMRDLYVIPVAKDATKLPEFIDMLEHCTIEMPRSQAMLLLALVAKLPDATPQLAATQHFERYPAQDPAAGQPRKPVPTSNGPANGPQQSPAANPHAPQFSPLGANFPPGQYGFPHIPPPGHNGHPQQPFQYNAEPHHQIPRAVEILGPYINAPAAKDLLKHSIDNHQPVPDNVLSNLRAILDEVPDARNDLRILSHHLTNKNEAQRPQ